MNRRIKKRFDVEGIEIPFPHRAVYFGEASLPFKLQLNGSTREELKQIVREVLAERRRTVGQLRKSEMRSLTRQIDSLVFGRVCG